MKEVFKLESKTLEGREAQNEVKKKLPRFLCLLSTLFFPSEDKALLFQLFEIV